MEFAVKDEETPGGVLQREAEGVRLSPESGREGVRDLAGMEEASGGEKGKGFTERKKTENAEEGSGLKAEEMQMNLTVVKQEVMDWSYIEGGQWVKQEVEDGPEVKDEKAGILEVKQEVDNSSLVVKEEKVDELGVKEEKVKVKEEVMDWPEVKEEKEDYLEIKQEMFVDQDIKEEEMMDGTCVKEEKDFMKKEMTEDTKVKEEPEINPLLGCKRKLAMSR